VARHAIYLSLQLLTSDRALPVIFQRLRLSQIVCDFLFELRFRHYRIQRWLGIGAIFWPDPVTPVNFFDRSLICDALGECERSFRNCSLRPCEWDHAHSQ
jgi:hypothetical protein